MAKAASRKRAVGAKSPNAKRTARRSAGPAATKRGATKRGATKRGVTKRAVTKRAATKRAATKRVAPKRAAAKRAATKRAATSRTVQKPRAAATRNVPQGAGRKPSSARSRAKAGARTSARQDQSRLSKVATAVKGTFAGAVAAVARTVSGGTEDAISLLEADHRRMEDLLKRGEATTARAVKERGALLDTLTAELRRHEQMEEDVLYPALAAHPEAKDIVAEGFQEHHLADVFVQELHGVASDTEQWQAKFTVLKESLEHHIDEEEGEMFRTARAIFSEDELQAMAARMAEVRAEATKGS